MLKVANSNMNVASRTKRNIVFSYIENGPFSYKLSGEDGKLMLSRLYNDVHKTAKSVALTKLKNVDYESYNPSIELIADYNKDSNLVVITRISKTGNSILSSFDDDLRFKSRIKLNATKIESATICGRLGYSICIVKRDKTGLLYSMYQNVLGALTQFGPDERIAADLEYAIPNHRKIFGYDKSGKYFFGFPENPALYKKLYIPKYKYKSIVAHNRDETEIYLFFFYNKKELYCTQYDSLSNDFSSPNKIADLSGIRDLKIINRESFARTTDFDIFATLKDGSIYKLKCNYYNGNITSCEILPIEQPYVMPPAQTTTTPKPEKTILSLPSTSAVMTTKKPHLTTKSHKTTRAHKPDTTRMLLPYTPHSDAGNILQRINAKHLPLATNSTKNTDITAFNSSLVIGVLILCVVAISSCIIGFFLGKSRTKAKSRKTIPTYIREDYLGPPCPLIEDNFDLPQPFATEAHVSTFD